MGAGVVRLQLQRLLEVAAAQLGPALHGRLGAEHERLGGDRLENHLRHLHRALARHVARLEREQHAALGIGQPQQFAQFVGNRHGADRGQVELLGHRVGGEGTLEADHDRRDLAVGITDFDPLERLDGVELHQGPVGLRGYPWACPRLSPRLRGWTRPGTTPLKLAVSTATGGPS